MSGGRRSSRETHIAIQRCWRRPSRRSTSCLKAERARDRCRLVRIGTRRVRHRIRHTHRSIRETRRSTANCRPNASVRQGNRRRHVIPNARRDERATTRLKSTDHDRRRRGLEKAAYGAQYADKSNLICDDAVSAHKLDVLAARCVTVGRDRSEITISKQKNCCITPTQTRHARTCLRSSTAGLDVAKMSEDDLTARLGRSYGATRIKLESNSRRCLRPTTVSMASPSTCSPTGSLRAASSCSATLSLPCSADLLKDQASGLSSRVSRVPHRGTRPCTCCAAICRCSSSGACPAARA